MHCNDIQDRGQLASVIKKGRTTVYNSFDENWAGDATTDMIAALAGTFRVTPAALITVETEAAKTRRRS